MMTSRDVALENVRITISLQSSRGPTSLGTGHADGNDNRVTDKLTVVTASHFALVPNLVLARAK